MGGVVAGAGQAAFHAPGCGRLGISKHGARDLLRCISRVIPIYKEGEIWRKVETDQQT